MRGPLLLFLTLLPLALAAAEETGFFVRTVATHLEDDVYILDADLDYRLSPAVSEALENGVPIVIRLEIEVLRPRDYLWDEEVAELTLPYQLRYHAISRQYRVRNLITDVQQGYPSAAQALAALGAVRKLPMLDRRLLKVGQRYEARLKAQLDIEALPAPLRLVAWFSPAWRLRTPWKRWALDS